MFDRLGSILKSYIDNECAHTNGRNNATKSASGKKQFNGTSTAHTSEQSHSAKKHTNNGREGSKYRIIVPRELINDFIRLGLTSSANLEICKKTHKRLMVKYHPDKHTGNPFALIQAHEMSARINMSFQRISRWFSTGIID